MERGRLIAGKYELRMRLGRGGMGEVWAGRDRDLHRNVAVKLLARDDDASPDLVHRFEREAVAAAQINHPNVVSLYDRGIHDGLQFLVMEHIDGTTLARHMHEHAPIPVERALEIAREICAALVAAHRSKVVHYDIKPSNVMLTTDGRVKVVDFGISGFTHAHSFTVAPTTVLAPAGTADYGAPEQFLNRRGDERSDLYSLGCVLFALLTGKPPYGEGNALSAIRRKLDEDAPSLSTLRPDAPEPVAQLLADLLQRDPDRRPQSASAVYERLERLRSAVTATGAGGVESDTERLARSVSHTRILAREAPEQEDAFEITWTGEEPISTYTTHDGQSMVRHWLLIAVLVPASIGTCFLVNQSYPTDRDIQTSVFLAMYGVLAYCIVHGWRLLTAVRNRKRHRNALKDRRPWSLRVDATGITTADPRHATARGGPAGRRTYDWNLIAAVTLEHAAEFRWGPTCTALHIQPVDKKARVNSISPAGMVHPRSPKGTDGRHPLCALGPLNDQEHRALVVALARHGGSRWQPELSR
ncbi:serine/threonine-protein kinase [Streptomyces sp. NPDC050095]|uniref:serine/threonine-protein kinase n=1 Tax=unclassified Streptomyces TaxID=2593676 RepID=UPI0034487311